VALEVERLSAICPLSPREITEWVRKLGGGGTGDEWRLQNLVAYWFYQANSLSRVWQATDDAQARDYVKFRLEQGDAPDTITLPEHFYQIDKWLTDLSDRLSKIRIELLGLPAAVRTALRDRLGDYDEALDQLAPLPETLSSVAREWHRRGPGQPALELLSEAVGLLTLVIEDYTGKPFPSPRSNKQLAEIELVKLLAAQLFPKLTPPNVRTMLSHFHNRRLNRSKCRISKRKRSRLWEYSS
jgi:hypothetical protein